jgi:hypothetical protein
VPTNRFSTVNAVPEAVVNSVCPATLSAPCDESEDVATITPPVVEPTVRLLIFALIAVRLVKNDVTALINVEKRFVDEALIIEAFCMNKSVAVAEVMTAEDAVRELIAA